MASCFNNDGGGGLGALRIQRGGNKIVLSCSPHFALLNAPKEQRVNKNDLIAVYTSSGDFGIEPPRNIL